MRLVRHFLGILAVAAAMASGSAGAGAAAIAQEQPVAAEKNPPGDIPDSQVFVVYRSPLGVSLKVPEGWARTDRAEGASFVDKYDGIDLTVTDASKAPTAQTARQREVAALIASSRAVKVSAVRDIRLPAGPAVLIIYTSNSDPNPVTNKQIRLENNRYLTYRSGKLLTLDLWAPAGADNADQWQLMSRSLRWD